MEKTTGGSLLSGATPPVENLIIVPV